MKETESETIAIVAVIRTPKLDDLDAVLKIEENQSPHPWKQEHFKDELSNPLSHFYIIEDCIKHQIIGYMVFWIIDNIIELHNIAIADTHKRMGLASRLMNRMFETANQQSIEEGFLEVRRSNKAAIRLYHKMGFQQIGEREAYYRSPIEDACIFRIKFGESDYKGEA